MRQPREDADLCPGPEQAATQSTTEPSAAQATEEVGSTPADAKPTPAEAPKPETKPKAKPEQPGLNQSVRDGDFTFTVTKVEYSSKPIGDDTEAAIYLEEAESLFEEINPGNKLSGIVVFDVPKDTKVVHLELHDSALSDGITVFVE